jgi:hypothetical protein
MQRINRRSFLFLVPAAALLPSCADFWVEKDGGVVSGCVDASQKDRCPTVPPKDPQSVPPQARAIASEGWISFPYQLDYFWLQGG